MPKVPTAIVRAKCITGWTWGNGTASASRTFDTDGKLTALSSTATAVGNRTLGYDDAFRITSSTDSASGGPAWTYGYDILDRLNAATKTGTTMGYTYDANGNRLTQTGTTASTHTVSGTSNKLSSTSGGLVRSYTYNASGSVLTSGVATHTYYNSGRMKTGKLGAAGATTYIYNALGQRIKKSGGAIATAVYFMYDEAGHLVGEYTISGSTVTAVQETVWLGDIPVATLRPIAGVTTVFYVHTDQLNSPRKVTNTANQLRWKWDPTPFGEGAPVENPNPPNLGAFKYHLRFPGQYFDLETNLNYNYFRDYDPAVGRYAESDPIGLNAGVNTYAYVASDPLLQVDLLGLAESGGCFDFIVNSVDSFEFEIIAKSGKCPYEWLIKNSFKPGRDLKNQRMMKDCSAGQCVDRRQTTELDWKDKDFEFDLCWNLKGDVAINVPCGKKMNKCHVKFKITAKGAVTGWVGDCEDCKKE